MDRIAAEDTRRSRRLLDHYGIATPMVAVHEHNERRMLTGLLRQLREGSTLALISDAGTPLISDPGFALVRAARAEGIRIVPIPGPSAVICALSAAGLPTDRFVFEGFLPSKSAARRTRLQELAGESRTVTFYEASHRIVETLNDLAEIFGGAREALVARELTKTFETIRSGELSELADWVAGDANQQKGEFVVVVHGFAAATGDLELDVRRVVDILLEELPVKQAAALAARITGVARNRLYAYAVGGSPKG
ncbi:MAG TPA: 16S rRNA (cytidine(1402)-2'-O)-methyltransferase [Gammaproteobacteria bacterium]|nr:16S rRNA (cytidine(1402)-2'-O)-methyltransferase [Gammaproteobacteria bacterium]